MNSVPGILKGIALLVVIVAIGVGIGVFSSKKPNSKPTDQPAAQAGQTAQAESAAARAGHSGKAPSTNATPAAGVKPTPQAATQVPGPQTVLTNWETKLDDILSSETEEKDKAAKMAELLPKLPEEGQMEVAQHLSNLVADEDYASIAGFLTSTNLPESVLDVFLADSLNRPNAVKLPLLLEVAQSPQNPKAEEAKEILQLFLEEDYGTDWNTWKAKLDEWLKNNPD